MLWGSRRLISGTKGTSSRAIRAVLYELQSALHRFQTAVLAHPAGNEEVQSHGRREDPAVDTAKNQHGNGSSPKGVRDGTSIRPPWIGSGSTPYA